MTEEPLSASGHYLHGGRFLMSPEHDNNLQPSTIEPNSSAEAAENAFNGPAVSGQASGAAAAVARAPEVAHEFPTSAD